MKKADLCLVDGSSYLYRAFYAMPNLSNSAGEATGATYGIVLMLRRLLAALQPRRMAVVFDAPGKTFRDELYADYKAQRAPMPPTLRGQLETVHAAVEAMGLPLLRVPGVEADDVIGTLAAEEARAGGTVWISSGDKDLAQLVNDRVQVVDDMKNTVYDRAGVVDKFGVPPERIVDYLSLVGDAVDNIPGVPKAGPKTVRQWLGEYGSLDGVMANAGKIKGVVGENLRASLANLPLSRALVTIKTDVKLDAAAADLKLRPADDDALRKLFTKLEFKTWLAELGGLAEDKSGQRAQDTAYDLVLDEKNLRRWAKRLEAAAMFSVFTAVDGEDVHRAELLGIAFSDGAGRGAYVPLAHEGEGAPGQLAKKTVLAALKPVLEDAEKPKAGHDLKRDAVVFARENIALKNARVDVMLESYALDSTGSRHDLGGLSLKYLGHKSVDQRQLTGTGKKKQPLSRAGAEDVMAWAAEAADVSLRLHQVLAPKLAQFPGQKKVLEEIEMPLLPVLARMEAAGVAIDPVKLRRQSAGLSRQIADTEMEAHRQVGVEFNIASPKQIQEMLYGKLNIPVTRKTPTGQPSTAESVLQELALEHELPRLILEHRGLSKLKSTYTDKLPELINPRTGRIHTCYHQAVAATGRLSSSDPNLQNIPVRTKAGRRIREAFVPAAGRLLLSADYSQIELRIMAHLSGDAGLLDAFRNGEDIHRRTAGDVFGIKPEQVTDEHRRRAKAINFGLIYGMSPFGLARQLRITRGEAKEYVELYFSRYPGVREFMQRTRAEAHEQGYVETVFGRRLYLPEINATNHARRQYAERTAINAPMQGTAADLIKMAMLKVDAWIRRDAAPLRMIMQVHDELVFEVAAGKEKKLGEKIAGLMCGVATLKVPLVAEIGAGKNWAESHP